MKWPLTDSIGHKDGHVQEHYVLKLKLHMQHIQM